MTAQSSSLHHCIFICLLFFPDLCATSLHTHILFDLATYASCCLPVSATLRWERRRGPETTKDDVTHCARWVSPHSLALSGSGTWPVGRNGCPVGMSWRGLAGLDVAASLDWWTSTKQNPNLFLINHLRVSPHHALRDLGRYEVQITAQENKLGSFSCQVYSLNSE